MIHFCDGHYETHSCRCCSLCSWPAGQTKVTLSDGPHSPSLSIISLFTQSWFDWASSLQLPPLISSLCSWKAMLMSLIFTASSGEPCIESITLWLLFVNRGRLCNYEFFLWLISGFVFFSRSFMLILEHSSGNTVLNNDGCLI